MSYSHFTPFERGSIFQLLELGYSHNNIAKCLNRHRSSIDREINRNSIDGMLIRDQIFEGAAISTNIEGIDGVGWYHFVSYDSKGHFEPCNGGDESHPHSDN